MDKINLKLYSSKCDYDFTLDRRMNIVRGYSGVGKTTLVDLILRSADDSSITIQCDYNLVIVNNTNWESLIKVSEHSLLIFDDMTVASTNQFASLYKNYSVTNDLCFLLMFRDEFDDTFNLKSLAKISFSSNNIFKLCNNGKEHWLEKLYSYSDESSSDIPELIIVEDRTKGFEFFTNIFKNYKVVSSDGKANLNQCIMNYIRDGYKSIFIIVDTASYGCHMEEFDSLSLVEDCDLSYMSTYECFEEMLLQTNLVNKLWKFRGSEANSYYSWERYFEAELQNVTASTFFRYNKRHGKLRTCYYEDCLESTCDNYKFNNCEYKLLGDKIKELFIGTKYEFLLSLI